MKLLERWNRLLGQVMTLIPAMSTALAEANPAPQGHPLWREAPSEAPPAFRNTLNGEDALNLYAAHRSHSSHSSHRSHSSHSSHSSHYSGSGGYSAPRVYSPPDPAYSTPRSEPLYAPPPSPQAAPAPAPAPSPQSRENPSIQWVRPSATDLENLVKRMQMALMVKHYYSGPLDGVLGKGTRDALMAFQMDAGLELTGRMDTPTLNALGIALP